MSLILHQSMAKVDLGGHQCLLVGLVVWHGLAPFVLGGGAILLGEIESSGVLLGLNGVLRGLLRFLVCCLIALPALLGFQAIFDVDMWVGGWLERRQVWSSIRQFLPYLLLVPEVVRSGELVGRVAVLLVEW